jgi:cobalamin biosynthesis Mg chelatase CobN
MKATDLLKQHHRELEQLFIDLLSVADAQERRNVREELALKLVAHTTIERELFYAELERTDTLAEAYEEHAIIDWGLQRLLAADLRMDTFRAKTTVLKQIVEHHLSEEEDTLLPQAERTFGSAMLDELGQRMARRYGQIVEQQGYETLLAQALGVPKGQLRKAHPTATAQRTPTKRAASAAKKRRAPAVKKRATATKKRSAPASKKRAAPKRAAPKRTHAAPTRRTTKAGGVSGAKKGAKGSARGRKTS